MANFAGTCTSDNKGLLLLLLLLYGSYIVRICQFYSEAQTEYKYVI